MAGITPAGGHRPRQRSACPGGVAELTPGLRRPHVRRCLRERVAHLVELSRDGIHQRLQRRTVERETQAGRFELSGIPPMPAGVPQIEVTYDMDANGILHVTAKEKSTGKEASITIQNTTTLSEDEVDRMVADAKSHAEDDRKFRETAEAKNQLDGLRLTAQKTIDEAEGASDDQKKPVQDAIAAAQQALDGAADKDELEAKSRDLSEKLQAFSQAVGQSAAEQGEAAPDSEQQDAGDDDEEVIDADFKPAG